ncbi:MAG: hypothetical protein J6I64_00775, partial [Lachnospiraceae bacterium]|nr:hypothetical protein [Lachnospiraceae bacterium]
MNKRWWKLLRLLLAICLSLGMVGCGDAGEDDVSVNTAAKDYVFRETEIDLGNLPIQDIRFVCQMEGRVCVYGMNYGDQGM